MEIKANMGKLRGFIDKYKYVALVVLAGIVLMLIPIGNEKSETVIGKLQEHIVVEVTTEEQLAEMLRQTQGVGEVRVLLTKGEGEETIYQTNVDSSNGQSDERKQTDTVTVTDADRTQRGLVRQVNPARFLGAVIVCQGADDPQVRLQVIDAVSKATGLKSNCIAVLKMK